MVHINTDERQTYVDRKLLSYKYDASGFSSLSLSLSHENGRGNAYTEGWKAGNATSNPNPLLDVFLFKSIMKSVKKVCASHLFELDIGNNSCLYETAFSVNSQTKPFSNPNGLRECRFTYYMAFIWFIFYLFVFIIQFQQWYWIGSKKHLSDTLTNVIERVFRFKGCSISLHCCMKDDTSIAVHTENIQNAIL